MAILAHAAQHRLHDLREDAAIERRLDQRARRKGAHAAGVRARVAIVRALVILRRAKRHRRKAVGQHEERHFRAAQTLFQHDARAGLTETGAAHHVADGRFGLGGGVGQHHALAGRQAVGLHDERPSQRPARATSSACPSSSAITNLAVGTPWRAMNAFAQALLVSSRAAASEGPTIGRPAASKASTTPKDEGKLGTDQGQSRRR